MKLGILTNGLLLEYAGAVRILPWSEEAEDYDPWVAADQADNVAGESDIRIDQNKELYLIALNERGDVVGAIWSALEPDEDQNATVFSFDVAVDPEHRSGQAMIGIKLINSALEEFESFRAENPRTYVRVYVVNRRLANVLERKYGFEVESEYPHEGNFGSKHMTYYGN